MDAFITVLLWCIQLATALLILVQTYFNMCSAHAHDEILQRKRRAYSPSTTKDEMEIPLSPREKQVIHSSQGKEV